MGRRVRVVFCFFLLGLLCSSQISYASGRGLQAEIIDGANRTIGDAVPFFESPALASGERASIPVYAWAASGFFLAVFSILSVALFCMEKRTEEPLV